jgi:hypothetical protein
MLLERSAYAAAYVIIRQHAYAAEEAPGGALGLAYAASAQRGSGAPDGIRLRNTPLARLRTLRTAHT